MGAPPGMDAGPPPGMGPDVSGLNLPPGVTPELLQQLAVILQSLPPEVVQALLSGDMAGPMAGPPGMDPPPGMGPPSAPPARSEAASRMAEAG